MEFNYAYMKKRFNIYINQTEYKKILWLKDYLKKDSVNVTVVSCVDIIYNHYLKKQQEQEQAVKQESQVQE